MEKNAEIISALFSVLIYLTGYIFVCNFAYESTPINMKKLAITIMCLLLAVNFAALETKASQNDETQVVILLQKQTPPDEPVYPDDLDPEGRRLPSKPIMCIISPDGILIDGIDNADILLYEAYDELGSALVSTSSEYEFVKFVLSSSETIEIHLYLQDYILCGYLEI